MVVLASPYDNEHEYVVIMDQTGGEEFTKSSDIMGWQIKADRDYQLFPMRECEIYAGFHLRIPSDIGYSTVQTENCVDGTAVIEASHIINNGIVTPNPMGFRTVVINKTNESIKIKKGDVLCKLMFHLHGAITATETWRNIYICPPECRLAHQF